jgi:predicted GNAT superfamily acetyltransferase
VWGDQPIGREVLRALQHAGCCLYGARSADGSRGDPDELVGYVFGFVGVEGGLHLHSHMLAVLPEWRGRSVGFALKLAQRAWAIDHGLQEVRWTFDPVLLGNARFNLQRLGALATRYLADFYGPMIDDINRGERTDRFEVHWLVSSERVMRAVSEGGGPPASPPPDAVEMLAISAVGHPQGPEPAPNAAALVSGAALVAVAPDHMALRRSAPDLARRWREASGAAFAACFDHGLIATGVTADGRYLFEPAAGEALGGG